jgi:hypothetical protein
MCATEKLVLVFKEGADRKGRENYCLYYEDSKIKIN